MTQITKTFTGKKRRDFVCLLAWLDRVAPWQCRAMAVKKKWKTERMTNKEISELSGIPIRTVQKISYQPSWDGIPVGVASRFAFACGVNLLAKKPERKFLSQRFKRGLSVFKKSQRAAFDRAASTVK
jgi:hypothetical protein